MTRGELEAEIETLAARRADLERIEHSGELDIGALVEIAFELDEISDCIGRAKNALFDMNQQATVRAMKHGRNLSEM